MVADSPQSEPSLRSDDPVAQLAWIDEWARRNDPTHLQVDIAAFEAQHLAAIEEDYGRLLEQSWVEFASLVALVDQLNFAERDWPAHRSVQYVLLAMNLKSFASALDRLSKGYYEDALAITRGLYETFLRLSFISLHRDHPYAALDDKPPRGTPKFIVTNFVRDQLRLDWTSTYSILSVFAHSNMHETMKAIFASIDEPEARRHGLVMVYDRHLFEVAAPLLQFVLLAHLRFATECLTEGSVVVDLEQLATANEAVEVLMVSMTTHPKPFWRTVADDLDYVFELIRVADVGSDWKTLRDHRDPVAQEQSD
jgi:hypothetical protein